ncbi:Adenosine/AMP deaminase [Gracilaria domingensis]|nr:Adenosine/AMP deaminase [Gracilaria domingensis]
MASPAFRPDGMVGRVPKIELHAHLSGSVRERTIRTLLQNPKNRALRREAIDLLTGQICLEKGFRLFPIIHQLISDPETLNTVLQEVLDDFAEENTVYIELRTTPRILPSMSAKEYLLTVLRGVSHYHAANEGGMVCRVIVSICRHHPVQNARDTVELTRMIMEEYEDLSSLIVGFDFSGDPNRGSWSEFEPVLKDIRRQFGLPITLHFGEVSNDDECMRMLDFGPDRIGHAAILSKEVVHRLLSQKPLIPVEVCLTSNMMTTNISNIAHHPVVKYLLPNRHPFSICTDDAGIFRTSLSQEYRHLLSAFPMSTKEVTEMALCALDMVFCRDEKVMSTVRKNASNMLDDL